MHSSNQIVHALWIGPALSKLELLSIYSFLDNGHKFHLWLYAPIATTLPEGVVIRDASEIIPISKVFCYKNTSVFGHGKGSYAGFSDIFRYKLLYEKGGWWVDMDVTCLKPLDFEPDYFFRSHHELNMVGNVMKCPAGSELMKLCYDEAVTAVDENNTDWLKPIAILNRHIKNLGLQSFILKDVSNEDRWHSTCRFIWDTGKLATEWYFVHWQNEEWRRNAVPRYDFYYKSELARLMAKFGLYKQPEGLVGKSINTIRHSSYFRALENIFLADL